MSKRRKEERRKKRKKVATLVVVVVVLIAAVSAVVVYNTFIARQRIESFFPNNPIFFAKVNLKPSLLQAQSILKLSEKFEDPELFSNTLSNFIFGDLQDDQFSIDTANLTNWVGDEVAAGNIVVSKLDSVPVMVVHVKNRAKAKEFLNDLTDRLERKGNAVGEEVFREEQVVKVDGNEALSYALLEKDYLLLSRDASGVKKMIDVSLGSEEQLSDSDGYKSTKRILKGDKEVVFCYFELTELVLTLMDTFQFGDDELLQKIGYSDLPAGFVLTPESDGFGIKILASEQNFGTEGESFKEKFVDSAPHDTIFYLEGNDMRDFLSALLVGQEDDSEVAKAQAEGIKRAIELQLGLNVDEDLFSLVQNQYALMLLRGSEDQHLNFGLLFDLQDLADPKASMKKIEEVLIKALKDYKAGEFDEQTTFTSHTYERRDYRHLNMPDQYQFDVNYYIDEDKQVLMLASTESALQTLMDDGTKDKPLGSDTLYKRNSEYIDVAKSNQIIYFEPQAAFKLVDTLTDFDYGFLNKEIRLLESMGLKTQHTKDGVIMEGFLRIKEQ
ncbi:DUF3352 domain-containing protein [Patescibacteria group bacterium]|nr:DUF3352 domain-containing protein [Patescibacteria group bacterium]